VARQVVDDHGLGQPPLARRCGGFSIAAAVHHYQMCDLDTDNWHGRITCGTLVEVSLTDVPSNAAALVKTRIPSMPPPPHWLRKERTT
jgi:hypothetical protein